ncbi:uncharacterized protein LOC111908021 isoform X1 [Lactuca sativa]|uniref:uncharacterized protein LOC111908021 isoform X1 n=1 Tax=Lactuca sativa TaxID=4236 RepID=UPI000CD88923|nr:uncharacterized protein LOC111908021 isoform X1 [Lactuca sativa]XP_052620148.1 uncharacterized protein LOC111908021 isoform X1 [Lactuca sativa]
MSFLEKFGHLRIPLEEIRGATNNFAAKYLIGRGGSGKIYKGVLIRPGGSVRVAFKLLDRAFVQGSSDFWNEIILLSECRHENIINFVGFCDEGNQMILVYEFARNGSLELHLRSADLTWLKRLQICLGAARGLSYLHNQQRIIHRDLKSAHILLDQNWHAKIADFRLSKFDPASMMNAFLFTDMVGTLGYMDPLYIETGLLTKESDIYAFGIVLMEVLCGRLVNQEGKMVRRHYEERKLTEIIDPILRKQMSADSLDLFSAIAYQCLKTEHKERPSIIEVVEKLERVLELQPKFEEALAHQQVADNLKDRREGEEDFKVAHNLKDRREGEEDFKVKTMEHMKIPLKDIKSATHDFHEHFKIGRGGFGEVYKADLFHFDFRKYIAENRFQRLSLAEPSDYPKRQSTVAIKRLDRRYGQGPAQFLQELSMLPYLTHKNLVTLVGFCDEDRENILVYEYAPNGSLHDHIHSPNTTNSHTWARRLQICLDAASGLEFLHNGIGEHYRIIHRDIKSSNILLGQNYIGMISDFGLSKIGPANLEATFVMTQVAGTPLYIDPQYQKTGLLTKESDIYSFGVVLFEALSGRLVHFQRSKDDPEFLLKMAKRCFEKKIINEIIDSKFKKEFEKSGSSILDDETCPDSIKIYASIAYKCCNEKREDRPTIAEVVKELEKALKSHVNRVEAFRITLGDIRSATNDFRDKIEQGPVGEVYCGELQYLKGHGTVTIKRLCASVDSSGEEFIKEIARLYSYSHENVVPVLGFCEEGTERIIVLEHMVKGSLKDHLTNSSLMWKQRLKICIDAAYGIAYIHSHAETEQMIHGDLKSSSILLGDDWKASISDFIVFKGAGTLGYLDPLYPNTSSLTLESDVYSFGVVLFEILSGRLATETIIIDQQLPLGEVPNVEPQLINSARGSGDDERMIFLANWAAKCFKNKKVEDIIFHAIKKEIDPMSLVIFSTIANQCLREQRTDRPTMTKVVEELEKALDCQDEWEWEQKLPTDYKEIIQMSKRPVASTIRKKDIHSLLSSGMLLHNEKWFSISMDGARNEMASAKTFSYGDVSSVKWKSVQKSRFPKVARIPDISNLNIKIKIKTQFLTPEMMYGAYLVFKFCDKRKVSSRPLYVNLKYKKAGETLSAYFAEWEVGTEWLKVKLFQFSSNNGSIDVEILLESLSQYYCGRGAIYIEGIEFQAIRSVDFEHNNELKDGTNSEGVLINTQLDMDWVEKMLYRYEKIIRRYGKNVHVANGIDNKEVIYRLLSEGIHIDKGEKFFSLSKAMKNCHMLRASSVIYNSLNLRFSTPPTGLRCRFAKVAKILSHQDFRIKCDIETQMLSSDATYACFLVFKLSKKCRGLKCPVKARDLVPHRKERTKIISFRYPSTVNLDKIKWIPEQREDGWMEVKVWEFNVDNTHNDEFVPMDLKLTCFEGNMSGFIVYGIEFRPIA